MSFTEGDRVLVNLAPFIGAAQPSKDSVACEVLAVREDQIQVCPEPPCRSLQLWVHTRWIERKLENRRGAEMPVSA